jgi:hypothetical protein
MGMSYVLFQFNCGKDSAQGYVLAGRGEHDETNCQISVREMEDIIYRARHCARLGGRKVAKFTLLRDDPRGEDGLEVKRMVAEELDRLFLRAHAERLASNPLPQALSI